MSRKEKITMCGFHFFRHNNGSITLLKEMKEMYKEKKSREGVCNMHAKVKQALKCFGGKEESCVKLSSGFQNEVYEYTYGGERRILRITPSSRRTIKQIQSELEFIRSLNANGVNVSLPVAFVKIFLHQHECMFFLTFCSIMKERRR
ncbi:phosphotransferase [Bacillus sp. 3103sda1]|uniref:phosphotransferase n=1 Tax=Bacillus sp. 3103sda1 TaxID=2953808 RepID=UPI00209D6B67|nr:phosphotransferase [Bacillus sp. 3103sda1]MCP1125677.1 phosphotransferase [Bacillus sp. 3103sda1]